jgi:uncharacterized protein (DUF983 family)
LTLRDKCDRCGLSYAFADPGDGPAVFAIFILGFFILGGALLVEFKLGPPVWVHVLLWGIGTPILAFLLLRVLKAMLIAMMEASERQKTSKELSLRLIRKHLRIQNPEVVEAAYEDGVTLSYPYFTERQFQISVDLLSKSMEQPVQLNYKQVVDHSLLDEINRPGRNRPNSSIEFASGFEPRSRPKGMLAPFGNPI